MPDTRRPILHKGEVYNSPVERRMGGNERQPEITYAGARDRLLEHIGGVRERINALPNDKRLPNEFVVCYRMDAGYSAKSYYPAPVLSIRGVRNSNAEAVEIGSRQWRENPNDDPKKLYFVRTNTEGLDYLTSKLQQSERSLQDNFKMAVRRIKRTDLLSSDEQIIGFPDDWKEGTVEMALHPFARDEGGLDKHFRQLLKEADVDLGTVRSKRYEEGITFVSLNCNRKSLQVLANYNPLRTVHPLKVRMLPDLRQAASQGDAPQCPTHERTPGVTIGVFDGGINPAGNGYLEGFCENIELVKSASSDEGMKHGTAVTGSVLYGPLNRYKSGDVLPHPTLYVKHFRVLPKTDPGDIDLYEVIDAIEKVVPENKDIKVYNLSLGPDGPILDDGISRFTSALDKLQSEYGVVFCTAVGNDGEDPQLGRIQSPGDSVNGMGVGAHTLINGVTEEVDYSCYGPGREGNKHKPDISAYGGCERNKTQLLDMVPGSRLLSMGTSFASPLVASLLAQIVGYSNKSIDALTGRALLLHKCIPFGTGRTRTHHPRIGHGTLPENQDAVVTCDPNSYTLIYRGEIPEQKYVQLQIPWLPNLVTRGNVQFRWTLAISTPVSQLTPDDYTSSSLETFFYPNAYKYKFSKEGRSVVVDIQNEPDRVRELDSDGWIRSNFPASDSGLVPFSDEHLLRSQELKWDTIDCRTKNKRADEVKEPMFHLHALTRGNPAIRPKKVQYALVLTVTAPRAEADIYAKVLQKFNALAPVVVDAEVHAQVTVGS